MLACLFVYFASRYHNLPKCIEDTLTLISSCSPTSVAKVEFYFLCPGPSERRVFLMLDGILFNT